MLGYLTMKKMKMKEALSNFVKEERGAADIVAVVLIIIVAVALAWVFKDFVMGLIEDLFGQADISGLGAHE